MGKRAITVYSINVDTGGTVNIHGAKYISKFNSPFLKVIEELTVFFFVFFLSRHLTSVPLKDCTLSWIAKYI